MKYSALILILSVFGFSSGAKILGVLQFPSKSHYYVGSSVLYGLANKGHEVTILSSINSTKNMPNVRHVYLDGVPEVWETYRKLILEPFSLSSAWKFKDSPNHITEAALQSKGMSKLLNSGEKYDVVIIEPFVTDAFFGLSHVFNSHVVISSPGGSEILGYLSGNIAPFSFVPSVLTTYSDKMTFMQRVINNFSHIGFKMFNTFIINPGQKKLYEQYFKGAPDYDDIIRNASLFLINTNIISETPRPYLPNMIQVGGMHIEEPKKLPQDLQEYLDNSKNGVIFFSLGSVVKSADMPVEKRNTIMKVLSKLPQNILWKFENENLPGKPENIKINKWLPQSDILAHPNVKLFITHGGLLSSTETVYRGVPILGIPIFGDQPGNVASLVASGYGQSLLLEDLNEETFTSKLEEVLSNPRYRINIKRDSAILKDQPMKPLDRAIFWIEHIIRHKGGKHLRCASLDLSLHEYLLLDVIAFIVFVLSIFIVGVFLCIKSICKCFRFKSEKEEIIVKKKNKKAKRE